MSVDHFSQYTSVHSLPQSNLRLEGQLLHPLRNEFHMFYVCISTQPESSDAAITARDLQPMCAFFDLWQSQQLACVAVFHTIGPLPCCGIPVEGRVGVTAYTSHSLWTQTPDIYS